MLGKHEEHIRNIYVSMFRHVDEVLLLYASV